MNCKRLIKKNMLKSYSNKKVLCVRLLCTQCTVVLFNKGVAIQRAGCLQV
jgi:hypothetical protein